jgi:hypothetical protein
MTHVDFWPKSCRLIVMTILTALVFFPITVTLSSTAHADDQSFLDFPFIVHCELNGVNRAFYLSSIGPDGVAVYINPERQVGTITVSGRATPLGGDWSGSCSGKTLEQLRSAGQAYYLQH